MHYRKARMTDMEAIHSLITHYGEQGLMLVRSRSMLYESLREFTIAEDNEKLMAAGSLHILWEDLAEIRALAVSPQAVGQGVGKSLVQALVQEAKALGIPKVFALTYQPEFFKKVGFKVVDKDTLPHKVWRECINCPKFPNCDETALLLEVEV